MIRYLILSGAAGLIPAPVNAAPLPKPPAFATCAMCHKTEKGAAPSMGPNLWGVGNRISGTQPNYAYSPAMTRARIKWDRKTLSDFISAPQKTVPGTKMGYSGQKNPDVAADIAKYLLSLQ